MQSLIARAVYNDEYFVLGSLDLSAAFDVVNRDLLFERMIKMGLPNDIVGLLKDWLSDRMFHVEANGGISSLYRSDFGTGLVLLIHPANL